MTAVLVYPTNGRGAWPTNGQGGSLNAAGDAPGRFLRAPKEGSSVERPGLAGFRAHRSDAEVAVDQYAVFKAVAAVQMMVGEVPDGIAGPSTDAALKQWQTQNGAKPDGVFGPQSAKAMFSPLLRRACDALDSSHPELYRIAFGHVSWESAWDPGAVGRVNPADLGIAQINGPAHPSLSADNRLDPQVALPWMAVFVNDNLVAMDYNIEDAIAAYNLGRTGARNWIRDGRPDVWNGKKVREYVDNVKRLMP